jgi:hypothetical protein
VPRPSPSAAFEISQLSGPFRIGPICDIGRIEISQPSFWTQAREKFERDVSIQNNSARRQQAERLVPGIVARVRS